MDYYFVVEDGNRIVDNTYAPGGRDVEKLAQEIADEIGKEIYVIQGQHYGIVAKPGGANDEIDQEAADLEKLRRWNSMAA